MKADAKIEEETTQTDSLPLPTQEQGFHWKQCWYPVTFSRDLPEDRPYSFSLYGEPLVLFRQNGKLTCLTDRCPHRAAKLSDGQLINGNIECLYHGWQFNREGQCVSIPQLPAGAKIPTNACVPSFWTIERQGIIWVWPGEPEAADEERIPTVEILDNPDVFCADYVGDLPYDQAYLVENFLDPTHVLISHDRTEAGVYRENAQPLQMEVIERSVAGIRGRYRETRNPNSSWKQLDFIAPNFVHYRFSFGQADSSDGLALYAVPLSQGRSRILVRRYGNFLTKSLKNKPRWLEHLRQSKVFEEDLPQIVGQQVEIDRLGQSLKQVYLPLKTSDFLLIEYRLWLDKFGSSLPFYQGYATQKYADKNGEYNQTIVPSDRFSQHTQLCSSCSQVYQVTTRLKQVFVGAAIGIAALAIVTDGFWSQIVAVAASLTAVALAGVAKKFQTKFERSYKRR